MTSPRNERNAIGVLSSLMLAGMGLLSVPWFLTPPAYLDVVLRDPVFDSDFGSRQLTIGNDATGKKTAVAIEKVGGSFLARVGRINSGASAYTVQMEGYKPRVALVQAAALQNVRLPVDLIPTFGRLEITPVDATAIDEPVAATVKGDRGLLTRQSQRVIIVDLPPGKHRFSAAASGFCDAVREFDVREGKVTKGVLPLSPDLRGNEIARFVLGWQHEPRDLDSHFRKADAKGFPHPAHVYFMHMAGTLANGDTFARLDVDKLFPGYYETLTVRDSAAGDFKYFVHLYAGSGTIGTAGATVSVYMRGCQVRTFTPPAHCTQRIWNVASLHYGNGRVELTGLQQCENGFSVGPALEKPNR
jgi:hypothetical protein